MADSQTVRETEFPAGKTAGNRGQQLIAGEGAVSSKPEYTLRHDRHGCGLRGH